MNVSSIHKDDFYPPPELKNALSAAENLRSVFTMNLEANKDMTLYTDVMENLDDLYESLINHYKESYAKEQALIAAASTSYTDKQRTLIKWLSRWYDDDTIYTVLIERLSEKMSIPKSTVRWNLKGLREAGLIRAGDRNNKGVNVELTDMGRMMAEYLHSTENT